MAVRIQSEDFDVGAEMAALKRDRTGIGALVTFTGLVRDEANAEPVATLTLEHYPGMTEAEIARVEAEAHARWPLTASLIVHRYGELRPGDNVVLVITAAAHRQVAFEAAMFLMDALKSRVPFWKKEQGPRGDAHWVEPHEGDELALQRWRKANKAAE